MTQNAQTLIDLAEDKAAAAMDPEKFDFLTALEDNGIAMPTETVKVFTNADLHTQILALSAEQDGLLKQHDAQDVTATEAARAARLQEILAANAGVAARNEALQEEYDIDTLDAEEPVLEKALTLTEAQQKAVEEVPAVHSPAPARILEIQTELDELVKRAYAARLEITMEGLQPKVSQTLTTDIEAELLLPKQAAASLSPEQKTEYTVERHANELVARSITKIFNPQTGKTQDFSKERMPSAAARRLIKVLPTTETGKLLVTAQTLTYAAVLIDLKTDAGFPGGRTESQGKPVLGDVHQDSEGVG